MITDNCIPNNNNNNNNIDATVDLNVNKAKDIIKSVKYNYNKDEKNILLNQAKIILLNIINRDMIIKIFINEI